MYIFLFGRLRQNVWSRNECRRWGRTHLSMIFYLPIYLLIQFAALMKGGGSAPTAAPAPVGTPTNRHSNSQSATPAKHKQQLTQQTKKQKQQPEANNGSSGGSQLPSTSPASAATAVTQIITNGYHKSRQTKLRAITTGTPSAADRL